MDRIKELEAEIQRIKEAEAEKRKAKYQYLVGKCLHRAHRLYEKIIAIDRVNTDCCGDEYNSDAGIQLDKYGLAYAENIEKYIISSDDFNKAFDACIDLIQENILIKEEMTGELLDDLNLRQYLDVPTINFSKSSDTGDYHKPVFT